MYPSTLLAIITVALSTGVLGAPAQVPNMAPNAADVAKRDDGPYGPGTNGDGVVVDYIEKN